MFENDLFALKLLKKLISNLKLLPLVHKFSLIISKLYSKSFMFENDLFALKHLRKLISNLELLFWFTNSVSLSCTLTRNKFRGSYEANKSFSNIKDFEYNLLQYVNGLKQGMADDIIT